MATARASALDALVEAAQVFATVTAGALEASDGVTHAQLKVLTLVAEAGVVNNVAVARALGVHISNASRLSDRLVQAGMLDRRESATDRRHVELRVTEAGTHLLASVAEHRRAAFAGILDGLPAESLGPLTAALDGFVAAARQRDPEPVGPGPADGPGRGARPPG